MRYFKHFSLFRSRQIEVEVDEKDIIHTYLQLVKMKKSRPHIDEMSLLKKCYKIKPYIIDKIIHFYLSK